MNEEETMNERMTRPDSSLTIGTGTAQPGEIVRCGISIGRDICGNEREIRIIIVNGAGDGPIL